MSQAHPDVVMAHMQASIWYTVERWLVWSFIAIFVVLTASLLWLFFYIYRRQQKLQSSVANILDVLPRISELLRRILDVLRLLGSGIAQASRQALLFVQIYVWLFLFLAKQILPLLQLFLLVSAGTATVVELWPQIRNEFIESWANPEVLLPVVLLAFLAILWLCLRSLRIKRSIPPSLRVLGIVASCVLIFECVRAILGTDAADNLVETVLKNVYALFFLFFLECFILWHDFSEFQERGRERIDFSIFRKLFNDLAGINDDLRRIPSAALRDSFERKFRTLCVTALVEIFKDRGICDVDLTIMQFNQPANSLEIVFVSGDEKNKDRFDLNFAPRPGVSAAGAAFHNNTLVYIPDINYGHGIEVETALHDYRKINVLDSVYVPLSRQPYQSMLCTPIGGEASSGFRGVLNVSSPKRRAFSESEFLLAQVAASILAMMS